MKRTRFIAFVAAAIVLSVSTARAIPSLNPHDHILVGFEDPAAGGAGVNHHHWDPLFPLYPGNGVANDETAGSPVASVGKPYVNVSFDAYSAWDQNGNQSLYRNGDAVANFGHGFIRQAVPYLFDGVIPVSARIDFNNAGTRWELDAAAQFAVDPFGAGTGREFGMAFDVDPGVGLRRAEDINFNGMLDGLEDVNGNGLLDGFTVVWRNIDGVGGTRASWNPGQQLMEFDSTEPWFFGGAGNIPVGQEDFFTIALHEWGHIIGLNHINTGLAGRIMRSDVVTPASAAGTMGIRSPDIGSLFGALALYIQPINIPEPSTFALVGLGGLAIWRYHRRRKR